MRRVARVRGPGVLAARALSPGCPVVRQGASGMLVSGRTFPHSGAKACQAVTSASRQVASSFEVRANALSHTGGRRSVATERVHGCSTPSSNRPPQSHLPVPMPARRASPRVHDHDDGDGLKTGSVLGVGGNILGIGLSHEDRGEIRTHTQHPGIGTRAKVRHNVDRQSQAWIMRARRKEEDEHTKCGSGRSCVKVPPDDLAHDSASEGAERGRRGGMSVEPRDRMASEREGAQDGAVDEFQYGRLLCEKAPY